MSQAVPTGVLRQGVISVPILNMPSNGHKCPDSSEQDPILKRLGKYKDYPVIKLIKAKNNSKKAKKQG